VAATVIRSPDTVAGERAAPPGQGAFRYGAVFALTLLVVVVAIVAPPGSLSRAAVIGLESAALVVVVATSRARADVRRTRGLAAALAAAAFVVAIAAGAVPVEVTLVIAGLIGIAIPLALAGGLLRLVGARGATLQAVAGALAIYLCIGLTFAWIIGLVARIDAAPYFNSGTDGSESDRVYFSFTVLTTTGFGDLTAASQVGHALAVLEMLLGQLYLVTVIGVLIGSYRRP
jgi:hypothetical protein